MNRTTSILGATILLALSAASASAYGDLTAYASSPDGTHISVGWYYYEYSPSSCPAWVGWDVYRRPLDGCGEWTRINPTIVPLAPVPSGNYVISDTPPLPNTAYQYELRFVDASRNDPGCALCAMCSFRAQASAPNLSAPMTKGRIEDWGWTVAIVACANSCANHYYVANSEMVDELRPYAGTGETFAFYGYEGCGTVEGCSLQVEHYELAGCDVTPARRSSWGALKTLYR